MGKIALSLMLGLTTTFVQAQTVYKCTGSNGSVTYSQNPCGKDARIVMQAHSSSEKSSEADERGSPPPPRKPDANIQAISDSADDSNCRRDAQRLAAMPSREKIEQANRQIAELNSRIYVNDYGQTSAGNAAIANRREEEIISLEQVISSEQTRNEALVAESKKRMDDALAECDRKKTEREARANR